MAARLLLDVRDRSWLQPPGGKRKAEEGDVDPGLQCLAKSLNTGSELSTAGYNSPLLFSGVRVSELYSTG